LVVVGEADGDGRTGQSGAPPRHPTVRVRSEVDRWSVGAKAKTLPFAPAFVGLAAPTEAKRPAGSTLRPLHYKTKAYDDVAPSHVLTRPGCPRGIQPIVTGLAQRSVLWARFVMAFL
jgi:hypothetical protein